MALDSNKILVATDAALNNYFRRGFQETPQHWNLLADVIPTPIDAKTPGAVNARRSQDNEIACVGRGPLASPTNVAPEADASSRVLAE